MGFLYFSGMALIVKAKINTSLEVRMMYRRGLNSVSPLFVLLTKKDVKEQDMTLNR
jgi:hypothetical protein